MNELTDLEQLLEKLGSEEVPGDPKHRYALRRALLESKVFEANRFAASRWVSFISVTGAAFAGGMVAVVIVTVVRVQPLVSTMGYSSSSEVVAEAMASDETDGQTMKARELILTSMSQRIRPPLREPSLFFIQSAPTIDLAVSRQ